MKINTTHINKLTKTMERINSPLYFYDLDYLVKHLTYIDKNKDPNIKLWYACKANPMSAILKVFRNLNFGIDIASKGELDQALRSGIEPGNLIATGPAKSFEYFKELLRNEVNTIVLESINQAYWLNEAAKLLNKTPKVLLRVQLSWEKGSSVLGGNDITPFGVGPQEWIKLDRSRCTNLDFLGFHVFQWGNILSLNDLKEIWTTIIKEILLLSNDIKIPIKVLDLGGGIGIPYEPGEKDLDFKDINDILVDLKNKYKLETIWLELGRYAVGSSGHYLAKVVDRKHVRGRELLILEGGINHICRPALTNQSFPCELYRNSNTGNIKFHIHGPLCTALDYLGEFELPADSNIGDWICFNQAGAYGFTEAMPFFLCHNLPAEVIIYNQAIMTPRTGKTSADWMI